MELKNIYHKVQRKKFLKKIQPYVALNQDSYYGPGFSVDLRNPQKNKIYLSTGKHCMLEGRYVFEKESGQILIGNRVHIGNSTFISVNEIRIDDDVTIAWDCLFYDHNSHSIHWEERKKDTEQEYADIKENGNSIKNKNWDVVRSAPIHICSKVWIGTGCKILKGVTIGEIGRASCRERV